MQCIDLQPFEDFFRQRNLVDQQHYYIFTH